MVFFSPPLARQGPGPQAPRAPRPAGVWAVWAQVMGEGAARRRRGAPPAIRIPTPRVRA